MISHCDPELAEGQQPRAARRRCLLLQQLDKDSVKKVWFGLVWFGLFEGIQSILPRKAQWQEHQAAAVSHSTSDAETLGWCK